MKPGRYLVTGAAGFVGSHLCERLLEGGSEVVGIDRFAPFYERELKERNLPRLQAHDRFELIEADLCEFDLLPTVAEVDGVFHLAAQAGVRSSWGEGFVDYVLPAGAVGDRVVIVGLRRRCPAPREREPRPAPGFPLRHDQAER
jgi:nucleoside-diphosphate-sugar epimerase